MDLTIYEMISKYGNSDNITDYSSVFVGGQSEEYIQSLQGLSEKFNTDVDGHKARIVNQNKLDGPPQEICIPSTKYDY